MKRLQKVISESGYTSRRKAEELIKEGKVFVNGECVTELGYKVGGEEEIEIDGTILKREEKVYILLNKPIGYVTTVEDQFKRDTVLDLVKVKERIVPVGRLDMYSEGLLLLTNDGEFANQIIHPTKHVTKKYEVELKKEISNEDIDSLRRGVDIGGYVTQPAIVNRVNSKKLVIVISEGKNRQIRKMCEAVNNKVVVLKRFAIGNLELENLTVGKYRLLSKQDIPKIFQ